MKNHKQAFLDHLDFQKGFSKNTISSYESGLELFLSCKDPEKFKEIMRQKNLSLLSQNLYLCAVRSFLDYLEDQKFPNLPSRRIFAGFRVPYIPPKRVITQEQFLKMTQVATKDEQALLEAFYSTGVRLRELYQIQFQHLDLPAGTPIRIIGKGRRYRSVYLSKMAIAVIRLAFPKTETENPTNSVFLCFGPKTVQRMVARTVKRTGLVLPCRVTPHSIRHLFAMNFLRNGISIHDIKLLLGHQSVDTTERYLDIQTEHTSESWSKIYVTDNMI